MPITKLWRELRLAFSQGRQQVTRAGIAFTAALLLAAVAAFLSANNLLFLILAAMFSTFLISGFVSKLGLAGLELDLILPEHISARRKVRASLRLKNLKTWIASFSIRLSGAAESGFDSILYFPVIPGGATIEESVTLYFAHRGAQSERSFQFSTRFPFGFAERREMVTLRHPIIIYPCLDPQPGFDEMLDSVTGEIEARLRGRGHDFYRIRPYEAFENAHHVDWRASAHTGELQVRDGKQPAPVWASVLAPASVRQFTVRPGSYAVVLAPARKTIDVAVSSGRATVVALVGTAPDGGYVWREQSDVAPSELEQTGVPLFIVERRLAPASYAPTSLDARGAGLTFVLRADF